MDLRSFIMFLLFLLFLASCSSDNGVGLQEGFVPTASIQISPQSNYGIGSVLVDGTARASFTLTNFGQQIGSQITGDFVLSQNFFYCGGKFPGAEGSCEQTLAPHASCTVQICFSPMEVGYLDETIHISYFDGVRNRLANGPVISGRGIWGSPGSWDTTFNNTGYLLHSPSEGTEEYSAVMTYADGTLAFIGKYSISSGSGLFFEQRSRSGELKLIREWPLGSLSLGKVSALLQLDEKVVVAVEGSSLFVVRWNRDGSSDTSFGSNGLLEIKVEGINLALGGIVQLFDRRIWVAGVQSGIVKIWSFNARGESDTGFGDQGVLTVDWDGRVASIASFWMVDNQIFIAATLGEGDQRDWALTVLSSQGVLDSHLTKTWDLQSGSRDILMAGTSSNLSSIWLVGLSGDQLWLMNLDGSGNEKLHWNADSNGFTPGNLLLQSDEALYVGGEAQGLVRLLHLDTTHLPDPLFGVGGIVDYDLAAGEDRLEDLILLPSGKGLMVGGLENGASWIGSIW